MRNMGRSEDRRQGARVVEMVLTDEPEPQFLRAAPCRPPLAQGLLGWIMSNAPVDAGVPEEVQRILASALCRFGRVTFLDSRLGHVLGASWTAIPEGAARVLAPMAMRRLRMLWRQVHFPLLCTNDFMSVRRLFDDPAFPWDQGGQIALLSPLTAPPPDLEYSLVEAVFEPGRAAEILDGREGRPIALMRPGPDGDFAHFITCEAAIRDMLWCQLSEVSAQQSIPFRRVDGATFSRIRWSLIHD